MKTYLSYGGGVNSTAMLLLLHDEGWKFEAIYVDHGCDWPETRQYVQMLSKQYPITILKPNTQGFSNLYDFCWHYKTIPSRKFRWCTSKFKIKTIYNYCEKPSFQLIGFDSDEKNRIKPNYDKGLERRYPLVEYEINREGCKKIITDHGFPVPIKSGCFICPFQRIGQWKKLRQEHPDLFCKAKALEDRNIKAKQEVGKKAIYLTGTKPLNLIVNEDQEVLWDKLKPPCICGL